MKALKIPGLFLLATVFSSTQVFAIGSGQAPHVIDDFELHAESAGGSRLALRIEERRFAKKVDDNLVYSVAIGPAVKGLEVCAEQKTHCYAEVFWNLARQAVELKVKVDLDSDGNIDEVRTMILGGVGRDQKLLVDPRRALSLVYLENKPSLLERSAGVRPYKIYVLTLSR
jgi:hypothetical protein